MFNTYIYIYIYIYIYSCFYNREHIHPTLQSRLGVVTNAVGRRSAAVVLPQILGANQADATVYCESDDDGQVCYSTTDCDQDCLHHVRPVDGQRQQHGIITVADGSATMSVEAMA